MNDNPDSSRHDGSARDVGGSSQGGLISRGELLLRRLAKEVAVARAEAMKADLEHAMALARDGNNELLSRWLEQHEGLQQEYGQHEDGLGVASPGPAKFDAGISDSGETLPSSWQEFLPKASQRLEIRRSRLIDDALGKASDLAPGDANKAVRLDGETPEVSPRQSGKNKLAGPQNKAASVERLGVTKKKIAAISAVAANESRDDTLPKRLFVYSSLGGVATSIIAHVLLLCLLAFVTLKLPSPPAGLAFRSVSMDSSEEAFELTQPLEVASPDAASEPTTNPESSFDISQDLAEISSDVSEALSSPLPASDSFATAAMAATASAVSAQSVLSSNAKFFGAAASGNCFCYVIDGSGSMRDGPWDAAKFELLKSLSSLKPKQRFYIIFFNRDLSAIPMPGEREPASRALYATEENLEHARRWVDTLRIGIGAPPNDALEMAIEKEPDAIYLLTDGVTTVDVAKFLREQNRVSDLVSGGQVRVPIHTIAFYSLEGQNLLKQIALENKGQFIYVPDPRKKR